MSAYLVRGVLVDTGFPQVRGELARFLSVHPAEGAFITHWHEDHGGNAMELAGRGIPIGMADSTEALLRAPGRIGLYRRICWGSPEPLAGERRHFEHRSLSLVAAPGHSADHHIVWDAERDTVFGGDLFIGVKVRVAHANEDLREQVRTLRAIAERRPARFFDAHRGPLSDPIAELEAKADWMERTIVEIEERAARGWTTHAIRDAVLGREDLTALISAGRYSRLNFVTSVLASTSRGAAE